ncbi:MAG: hypothetical protein AAFQ98_17840, partial [Bacteroidota bacterium]
TNRIEATTEYRFGGITPGDYQLRVLVDENGDGQWLPGNILTNTPGEKVFYYPGGITLRANWERNDVNITLPENSIQTTPKTEQEEEN